MISSDKIYKNRLNYILSKINKNEKCEIEGNVETIDGIRRIPLKCYYYLMFDTQVRGGNGKFFIYSNVDKSSLYNFFYMSSSSLNTFGYFCYRMLDELFQADSKTKSGFMTGGYKATKTYTDLINRGLTDEDIKKMIPSSHTGNSYKTRYSYMMGNFKDTINDMIYDYIYEYERGFEVKSLKPREDSAYFKNAQKSFNMKDGEFPLVYCDFVKGEYRVITEISRKSFPVIDEDRFNRVNLEDCYKQLFLLYKPELKDVVEKN